MKQPKSFEEGLTRLEEVLQKLSQDTTPLSEAVKLYADGAALIEYCNSALEAHKLQIEEIDLRLAQLGKDEAL